MATTAWFQYAWADATVAALDSWMWSGQYGASGMLQQLEQQPRHERAVKLYIKGHDDDDFLREFGTAACKNCCNFSHFKRGFELARASVRRSLFRLWSLGRTSFCQIGRHGGKQPRLNRLAVG